MDGKVEAEFNPGSPAAKHGSNSEDTVGPRLSLNELVPASAEDVVGAGAVEPGAVAGSRLYSTNII